MNYLIIRLFSILFIGSIITLLIPDGKLGKLISYSLYFLTIFSFISPLVNSFSKDLNLEINSIENNYVSQGYVNSVINQKQNFIEDEIGYIIRGFGIGEYKVNSIVNFNNEKVFIIEKVSIEINKKVIENQSQHIDNIDLIINKISQDMMINKNLIEVKIID